MTEFDKTNWANSDFSKGYRENADIFIVERRRMLAIVRSFYAQFVRDGAPKAVLDLGCGDGIVTAALAEADVSIDATLVDGSEPMLDKARERLLGLTNARYVRSSFQDLLRNDTLDREFDLIVSSLAIHHLAMDEKAALLRLVHAHLKHGGRFVNIDVVLAPSDPLEQWYLELWRDWIVEQQRTYGVPDGKFDHLVKQYKDLEENKPDTLDDQLDALRIIGFSDVDCYYKYGIFTIYGGRK